jgi:signal transduction histidine kinase
LEEFAAQNGLGYILPELKIERNRCPAVSSERIQEMKSTLWATSQFISQLLYAKLEKAGSDQAVTEALERLFTGFEELDRTQPAPSRFWNASDRQLQNLASVLDSRCMIVALEEAGATRIVAKRGFERTKLELADDSRLISSTPNEFDLSKSLELTPKTLTDCPLTRQVLEAYPSVNLVVFDKARLDARRMLHLLVYFDPAIPPNTHLFPHQKQHILSIFLRETVTAFLHAEQVGQLQKALADQEALLLDVVHQIDQPLQGILSDCESLLRERTPIDRKGRILRYLPHKAKQLAMLVKSVQYAGRDGIFRAAKHELSSVDLTQFLIESVMVFQCNAEDKSCRVEVDRTGSDPMGHVSIERDFVSMALTNVLFNAVKYSFPGRVVTVRAQQREHHLSIMVTNDGIEIKPSEKEVIFEKRVRTQLARRFSTSGLGIGLFVTREIMRGMNGDAVVIGSHPVEGAYKDFSEFHTTIALILPQASDLKSGG